MELDDGREAVARPRRVSARVAALGAVLFALTLAYAYPLRVYLAQQAEIARLEADQAAQRERIRQLVEDIAKWNDEEYIKEQARDRFLLVEVGEQLYVFGTVPGEDDEQGEVTSPPWYEQVWTSVQTADDPPTQASDPSSDS
jgi:cell division protein FtsB